MKMQRYAGEQLRKISFPLGGIGSGSVGLAGNGALIDWEIFNRPNKQSSNEFSHFAIRAEKENKVIAAKVLQGDCLADLTGSSQENFAGFGFGPKRQTMAGLPHFRKTEFKAAYPFAEIDFADETFPGKVGLTAFNPLIPLNSDDSSLPAAFFAWEVENTGNDTLTYTLACSMANPWPQEQENKYVQRDGVKLLHLRNATDGNDDINCGDLALTTDAEEVSYQEHWFKGGWFDSLTVFWREFNQAGKLVNRSEGDGHGMLAAHITLAPGEKKIVRFVLAWNVPNCHNYWGDLEKHPEWLPEGMVNRWKNYYATKFADSAATASYALLEWSRLEAETRKFTTALYDSTLPDTVLEAAGANMSILRTPTCLRLEDGSFYGFEGCCAKSGCCEGSCAHVWNYAYALPYLFPELERSMRNLEYRYSFKPSGEMPFRIILPLGRENNFRACADGQFGNIIKVYREWKLSGNSEWLKSLWPKVKQSIEFAWHPDNADRWDLEKTGVLHGRQHHTLDVELFGPNSWLTGFYLVALTAGAEMAEFCGDADAAAEYRQIYQRGREYLNRELFNGEYFQQQVALDERSTLDPYREGCKCACGPNTSIYESYWDDEHKELKYQIGDGCIIDQMLAQWHANILGLGDVFEHDKAVSALKSLYRYNFHSSFRDVVNPCRLYAVDGEAGTMICTWPEGKRAPWIPIPYSQEAMHGFEYAAAGQMMQYGMITEGLQLTKAVRDRYTGDNRNPWNEIECGSNYARSMASWAFIPILSGFSCDLVNGQLGFDPKISPNAFRCFWSCGTGWGVFRRQKGNVELEVLYGEVTLNELSLPFMRDAKSATMDGQNLSFRFENGSTHFAAPVKIAAGKILEIA